MSESETSGAMIKAHDLGLRFDTRPMKLSGWAAPSVADRADDEVILSLMAGETLLGTLRREVARPDVDQHLGYSGPPPGFSAPDFGLAAFMRITGLRDLAIVTGGRNVPAARYPMPSIERGDEAYDPLGSRGLAIKGTRLTDMWFDSSRDLSLRFEGIEDSVKFLDAYQCTPGAEPILINLAASQSVGGLLSVARVKLYNPYLPLLLVFKGHDGAIDGIDVIPFPSLARGGRHEAERLIVGDGSDDLAGTATLSFALLRTLIERDGGQGQGVTTIMLDPAVHTGLEPILNDDLLGWLVDFLGIAIQPSRGGGAVPEFIAGKLARHAPDAERIGHRLQLPADCIPTIAAVLHALPNDIGAQTVVGSMAVVEWNRHGHIWSIWQPPMADWFDGLQASEARQFAPQLELRPSDGGAIEEPALVLAWPLAIAIREKSTRVDSNSPFEMATDIASPLMRNQAIPQGAGLSTVILCDRSTRSVLPLLESLARQQSVGVIDVTVSRPTAKPDPQLSDALEALFPGRHRIIPQAANLGRLDRIVALSGALDQDRILILDAATVMPDPRTVATLLPMLDVPDVATAGCLVRVQKGKTVALSAGYSPTGISLRAVPALSFSPIDPVAFRQPATVAVVANTTAALVTTKSFLRAIKPQGSTALRPEVDDLLLGLQAIERGAYNLCTTLVSVYSDTAVRPTDLAITVPYRLSSETIGRIMASTAIVQLIR